MIERSLLADRRAVLAAGFSAVVGPAKGAGVDVAKKYGLVGNLDPRDDAKIRAAFEHEPAHAVLEFPPLQYKILAPLKMTKLPHESPHFRRDSYWPNFVDK
jgi:hypothetical protein